MPPALVQPLRRWDPEQIGGYVLLGRLGAGAMGQVYLGRSAAGRLVAVKTIKTELAEEPDFRTRFGQEVAAARRVSGAFTAAVVAADSEADVPWLATVYVPAPSLSKLVRTCGPLPVPAVRWLAAGCAEALESIHGVGLVHRDLKPSNVLVSPDGPRVIDFGVARAAERIQLTVTRGSVGTPAYMAPEQARDTRQATSASDIFSLGATHALRRHRPCAVSGRDRRGRPRPARHRAAGPRRAAGRTGRDRRGVPGARPAQPADVGVSRGPAGAGTTSRAPTLGSAPLPPAALTLIEEYRRMPRTSAGRELAAGPAYRPADGDSLPSGASPPAGASAGDQAGNGALRAGHRGRRGRDNRLAPGPARIGVGARADHSSSNSGSSWPQVRPGRRIVLAVGSAAAAAALLAAGWGIGTSVDGESTRRRQATSIRSGRACRRRRRPGSAALARATRQLLARMVPASG